MGREDVGIFVSLFLWKTDYNLPDMRLPRFLLPDLTPNPGLWWYFFTEMFDHFRPFFLMVFSVCCYSIMPSILLTCAE
jgi:hypothetical protein